MPERLFFELDAGKRRRIFEAGLQVFSEAGYNDASTNSIVKEATISKGSLFKYFQNKEDLYFYVLDTVIEELTDDMADDIRTLSGDLFEVIIRYAEIEFDWHISRPAPFRLLKKAFADDGSAIYKKTLSRYQTSGDALYDQILKQADCDGLRADREQTIKLMKWVLDGFNSAFLNTIQDDTDTAATKEAYTKAIRPYIELIKHGIYKQEG